MQKLVYIAAILLIVCSISNCTLGYEPTAQNLDAREKFQDDKFGIFIHWGVYSVPARGEWVMNVEKISIADYEPFAKQFNPVLYDPDAWCKLFKASGAKYITITSKHHDGFALWDTKLSDWNVVDGTPYGKDLLKPLAEACERHGLKLYFYYSQLDWHHPDYFPRGRTGKTAGRPDQGDFSKYVDYMNGQLSELLDGSYGSVAGIWFDGWWDQQTKALAPGSTTDPTASAVDWRLDETYGLIHKLQPACLVGSNHHVAPFDGEDFQMFEKDLPGKNSTGFSEDSVIGSLPLETCDTINGSWGYNAGDKKFKNADTLIRYLVNAAGRNANFLLNVGPKPDGTIDDESAARLQTLGEWLQRHGESIYGTRGGPASPQDWGVTTHRDGIVYLHILNHDAVDADGWLTLQGTDSLKCDLLSRIDGTTAVDSRRNSAGLLMVKLDWSTAEVDRVLVCK
jgi:alpha-L-fucosidase